MSSPITFRVISPHLGTLETFQLPFLGVFVETVGLQLFVVTRARLGGVQLEHRKSFPYFGGDGLNGGWSHGRMVYALAEGKERKKKSLGFDFPKIENSSGLFTAR